MSDVYLLVDANNLLMRSLFPGRFTYMRANGVNTGPLMIFINSLSRFIRETHATRVVLAWDGGRSKHRMSLDPYYKMNRSSAPVEELKTANFPLAKEFCSAANIPHVEFPEVEADDVLAAWWRVIPRQSPDDRIIFLSSDKDFFQLLGPNPHGVTTEQLRLSSSQAPLDWWTSDRVRRDLGCPPYELAKVLAIAGDTADGIRGVRGLGPKRTAALLAKRGWDFEMSLEDIPADDRDRVRVNLKLTDLRRESDVSGTWARSTLPGPFTPTAEPTDALWGTLVRFCDLYELRSVRDRLDDRSLWTPPSPGKPLTLS